MATSIVTVRMDSEVKKALDEFCASVGMNTSVAFNMFAKAVLRDQRLPFEVTPDKFYSKKNMEMLNARITELEEGRATIVSKAMDELEALENG